MPPTAEATAPTLTTVAVVGCGQMGAGITEVAALGGCRVRVIEGGVDALARGRDRIERSVERAVGTRRLSEGDAGRALASIEFTTDLDAVAGAGAVIEAIVEDETAKTELFGVVSGLVEPDTVLASNTSSIPIMRLAMAAAHPQSVVGIHFFNPVPVLSLVEVIPSLLTSPDTVSAAVGFARHTLGKHVIMSKDRAGFVVNALLIPYVLSAIRMFESGFTTATDIDDGMRRGCNHPMGPLELADYIGLDTVQAVANSLYDEFRETYLAPPPLLARMVDAGLLGRKSGHGFYDYQRPPGA